jgi:hypothetical protein
MKKIHRKTVWGTTARQNCIILWELSVWIQKDIPHKRWPKFEAKFSSNWASLQSKPGFNKNNWNTCTLNYYWGLTQFRTLLCETFNQIKLCQSTNFINVTIITGIIIIIIIIIIIAATCLNYSVIPYIVIYKFCCPRYVALRRKASELLP